MILLYKECEARSNPQLIQCVALFTSCGTIYRIFLLDPLLTLYRFAESDIIHGSV